MTQALTIEDVEKIAEMVSAPSARYVAVPETQYRQMRLAAFPKGSRIWNNVVLPPAPALLFHASLGPRRRRKAKHRGQFAKK